MFLVNLLRKMGVIRALARYNRIYSLYSGGNLNDFLCLGGAATPRYIP
jgi:hypothetical protein